ncbi:hypothetical protein [Nitrosomonas sp.]|uniref:hypothetical protein n=1 Tax=Nitrosomonas sp. TaxID=42353 RepID=UPI0025D1719E|nr:hypothetical protein [Nitrosomonas sp.]MBY0483335.1 ATP-binding protein [Nitrosomonas sp.]
MSIAGPFNPNLTGNLSAEAAIAKFRELLHCEARYAGLRPDAVTISANLNVSDGGIDAQVESAHSLPQDTFLKVGRNGFQLKTGTTFKPWQRSSLEKELLSKSGELVSEVRRTLELDGHYLLVCFGLDLTPKQRNDSQSLISELFAKSGFSDKSAQIEIFGQSQIASYFERYPSLRLSLVGGSDDDFLSVSEWSQHAHMSNQIALSEDQSQLINSLREKLQGETKHIRILGEPGIGKTRLVLEAVRSEEIAPSVLYVQHGSKFSQTKLFRELLRENPKYPLILILDELSEQEMSEIWGHLKNRCGSLKLISLDHERNRSSDSEIEYVSVPRLPDPAIKLILENCVGKNKDLDRWVAICEGSPRVAQAVGENLAANPDDILKPPATVPIWDRFLFGYAKQQSDEARQVALVMRHIALFSRFGFEDPVGAEAKYISELVAHSDSAVSWSRFQEIVQSLRERRILQGSRTLFIVPWALHIHLWREYWHWYGRGFDFVNAFENMPESLHGWFMDMFRYAHDTCAAPVVREILRRNGIYANRNFLCSDKGTSFLSTLAEAESEATLALIEHTFGTWSREELYSFEQNRQSFVWTLEKIAVWKPTFVRAARILARLAVAENATNSNNSTGTLLALFRIGPEWAATEASPTERLPALKEMLTSDDDELKRIGLKVAESALHTSGMHFRMIGPEHQGIKERAVLWCPQTNDEWCKEFQCYWDCLVNETRDWNEALRREANSAIIKSAGEQLKIPSHREAVFSILEQIANDLITDIQKLNYFFIDRLRRYRDEEDSSMHFRLRRLEGRLTRRNLASRFQRYVLDTTWDEWEDYRVEDELRKHTRPKKLVRALAERVAGYDNAFECLLPKLVSSSARTGALFTFGQALCNADKENKRLISLLSFKSDSINSQCAGGYLAGLKERDPSKWSEVLLGLLVNEETANRVANLVWYSGFDNQVLIACMNAFEMGWIGSNIFSSLCYGMSWRAVSQNELVRLFTLLSKREDQTSANVLVDLLDQVLEKNAWPVNPDFVFKVSTAQTHFEEQLDTMHTYHWHSVCNKLIAYDSTKALPLLDVLLQQMGSNYRLSYDGYVEPLAKSLCRMSPTEAWGIVVSHLLSIAPEWRVDILNWLKGGFGSFDEKKVIPPIAEFPLQLILNWIEQDQEERASMIAHCAPSSLDDQFGGALTRALLTNYRNLDGVISGISCNFHSGCWSGPRSQHLRARRDQFRGWLSKGFDVHVMSWIEDEIVGMDREIETADIAEERESWNRP